MKPVRFHEAARDELIHEVQYFQSIDPELGRRFAMAVEQAVQLAAEFPSMGSPSRFGTRRCYPKKFPFSVVYIDREEEAVVIALAPDRRKPGYWRSRTREG